VSAQRQFPRRIDALHELFAFTAETIACENSEGALLRTVDFVLEELFTNIVKYGRGATPVVVEIAAIEGGVEVTLTDFDAEPFDVTRAPTVDITLPVESRQPGGLGLHLIRKLVDSIEYRHSPQDRCSRITFRKTRAAAPTGERPQTGETNAGD
jgi:anti-sigma regulatory factor (Ser/Thr protein kinase)